MNRVGVLVVAAVVAVGSCFGLVRYASGAQDRAVQAAEPVPVMVAMKDVPEGMSFSTAARILAEGRGTQWDSTVVDVFVEQVIPSLLSQGEATGLTEAPAVDRMPAPDRVA